MNFFNPLAGRGARTLGIQGAADTALEGGKWWQDFEAAQRDAVNSAIHPLAGPLPRAAFVGLTGREPAFSTLYDDRGEFHPSLFNAERSKGGNPLVKRGVATAKEVNTFFGGAAEQAGRSTAPGLFGTPDKNDHSSWIRMGFDLAFPGLVGAGANPALERYYLTRQAALAKRAR